MELWDRRGKVGCSVGTQEGSDPTSGSQGGFKLCYSLILKPPMVSVSQNKHSLQGDPSWPCLPFCAPATTTSLSQPEFQVHPQGLCSHQCPAGCSSPDTCMLYALMSLRVWLKHHLLTCVPIQNTTQLSCSPPIILYNPHGTCICHISYLFICSSSSTMYAHEGGVLSVLFTTISPELRKAPSK